MEDLKELESFLLAWYNKTTPVIPVRAQVLDWLDKTQKAIYDLEKQEIEESLTNIATNG